MSDLLDYFACSALLEICAAAAEPDLIKKTRRLVDGLMVIPQPERCKLLAEGVKILAWEEETPWMNNNGDRSAWARPETQRRLTRNEIRDAFDQAEAAK